MLVSPGLLMSGARPSADAAPPTTPVNTVAPVITGTATVGQTLSVSNGTWTNSPTGYSRQWTRDGVAISGATAATYALVASDEGKMVGATVTSSNADGSSSATATAVGPVAAAAASDTTPDPISIPAINEQNVPGTYGGVVRRFTVTGINTPITLSLERSGQAQSGSPTTNRIDIYTKPAGGSYALVAQLGPVPGAVRDFLVANGTTVDLDWNFETAAGTGAASTSFSLILRNVTNGGTVLVSTSYAMSLTG